mmetsp:Transcript_16715/g.35314  ORF Transcript_16715/g.35314 Transcript_16715/m.35314 type:complete len:542 (+) Transcript_16715:240-1865(+)
MRRHTNSSLECLIQDLAERRVGVHHHAQLLHRRSCCHGIGALLNQIGGMDTNNVHGHNLSSILVVQYLRHAIALELGKGLGVGAEAAGGLAQRPSLLLGELDGLLFGGADHGNFGMGEARGGDGVVVDLVVSVADVFDGADALGGGGVGEHHLAVGVSDAVYVGHDLAVLVLGQDAHFFVHGDEAAHGLDACILESHVGGVGDTSGGNHGSIDFEGFNMFLGLGINHLNSNRLLPRNPRRNLAGKHSRPIIDGPLANQKPLGLLGNLPVERGHDVGKGLDEGDLASEGGVHVREFEADVPGADDGDPFGDGLELEGAVGGVDGFFVDGDAGWDEGDGSRGQDDVLGSINLPGALILHLIRLPRQHPPSIHNIHAQRHQTSLQIPLHPIRQLLGVIRHPLPIEGHLPLHLDPELAQVTLGLHLPHPSRRREEGLGRDAPPVDARSPDVLPGEDGRGEVLGPGVEGGAVAAHAAADDDDVEVVGAAFGGVEGGGGGRGRGGGRGGGGGGAEGGVGDRSKGRGCCDEGGGDEKSHCVLLLIYLY